MGTTKVVSSIWLGKNNSRLEPRQFKNNLTMIESKLILKLPPFFSHCVGEGKRRLFLNCLGSKNISKFHYPQVLGVICGIFVVCHVIRISLAIHEIFVVDEYRQSIEKNCSSVKFHILVLGTISHLLLTTNSSLNFFIYCLMSTEFRVSQIFYLQ